MTRQEVLDQISQTTRWSAGLALMVCRTHNLNISGALTAWFLSDSKLTARDKALVAFGASAAGRCVST